MAKKRNKKQIWIVIAIVVVLAIIVVLAINKSKNSDSTKVATELVELRKIVETVSANGKIQPAEDIIISPYISGEVVQLSVKEGDYVLKGEKLAKIDPEIYKTTYERMNAQVNSQKANLANSRARQAQVEAQFKKSQLDFKRNKKLWNEKVISDSEFEAVTSSLRLQRLK